jgi:endonuclease YncB( thermonuclease family)
MAGRRVALLVVVVIVALISSATNSQKKTRSRGGASPGDSITGKVVSIADGDTVTVLDQLDEQHRVRLFGIDAPEKSQAFGSRSKQNLADKVFGKMVRVDVVDIDRYGREVGRIYLGDRFINLEQVQDGCAWRYTQYDRRREFAAAEAGAREERRGLWSEAHPTPPWEYRREHRIGRSESRQGAVAR